MNELMKSMEKELVVTDNSTMKDLCHYMPEHGKMLQEINDYLPEIHRATSNFNKRQSQFMDNMLTTSHPTPIRNIRQILSEITRAKEALAEAHYKNRKKEVKIKIKKRALDNTKDELKKEMMQIEISELYSQLQTSQGYVSGAIRKITNHIIQMKSIIKEKGLSNFNEIDFEEEDEQYHIMKAFDQGLNAARSHYGIIDEGNMIYFSQLGINGACAQRHISQYLAEEQKIFESGDVEPTFAMTLKFLHSMAEIYAGNAEKLARHKGMTGKVTKKAALVTGDTRLLVRSQDD